MSGAMVMIGTVHAFIFKLFTTPFQLLTTLSKKPLENIEGKRENAGNQHFLLFPQCFQPYQRQKSSF